MDSPALTLQDVDSAYNQSAGDVSKDEPQSRLPLTHFDPPSVLELERTMTAQSQSVRSHHGHQSYHGHQGHYRRPLLNNFIPPRFPKQKLAYNSASTISIPMESGTSVTDSFDFEQTLRDLVRRRGEQSIKARELGVMFNDLRVVGLGARASLQPTMGSILNPLTALKNARAVGDVRDILSGFEGVVTPGEMLLVLGRPGSGCSTFLKVLSNQRGDYHAVDGEVQYDSFTPEEVAKQYRGDVIYCPEDDVHFPTLTVEQTLSFAIKTRTPHTRLPNQSREQYNRDVVDILIRIFGLHHARNTIVGNAAIRGVSGGERKRVSIAEALSCRSLINSWDNSTRGLDSSTALEFIQALRISTDIGRITTIVSLYQAGEQLYNLFDKVCVISEGRMVYFGPAKEARQYFMDMGYEPYHRQTTSDFLVSVTDPNARNFRPEVAQSIPRTAAEMAAHFLASPLGHANRQSIDHYRSLYVDKPERKEAYRLSAVMEHARHAPKSNSYTISIPMQVRAVMVRRAQIIRGDITSQVVQLVAQVFEAIVMGTVFLNLPDATSGYYSRGGILFFSLFFCALFAMAEIPALYAQRPIVLRHHKAAMYYPFIEVLAHTVVDIPVTFAIQAIFCVLLYFLVDLQRTVSQFFIFFMVVFTMTITMKGFFRLVAAMFKEESSATSLAGISTLIFGLYTGYAIPKPSIPGALRWITYLNPLGFGFASLMTNEFHTLNGTCSTLVPQGPGYENVPLANQVCTTVGAQPGMPSVSGDAFLYLSYGYQYSDLWRDYGIICTFGIGFLLILLFVTEFNTGSAFDSAVTLFKQSRGASDGFVNVRKDEEKGAPSSSSDHGHQQTNGEKEQGPPDTFTWHHLQYVVPTSGRSERRLLDNISGYVAPGKLTALMGESGAGKTTLLNVLAQRADVGIVSGDRFINGQPLPSDFQAQTGYCQQMDTHLPQATVRETVLSSAHLRQSEFVPMEEIQAHVDKCLKMCGLEAYADAVVGSLGVENKKRTTIAVELAAKPKLLLFLDEPTSGLDSQSAWAIITFLRELADSGQAILCTIHQPSGELFQLFDKLLLLRKGGQTVYFGDIGDNSSTMLRYFERNGAPPCDEDANPAEYMLDVIGAGATASSSVDWHNVWRISPEAAVLEDELGRIHAEGRSRPVVETELRTQFATSWRHQAIALTQRNFQAYWRNPTYLMAKLVLNIISGLIVGFTFYKSKDSLQGSQNKLFSIFLGTILCFPLSQQMQAIYIDIRSIYEVRERQSRMYKWSALVASQILVEIPWNILGSSIFFACWYWTVGFPTDRAGYTYLLYGIIFPIYYTTIALAIASMAPTAFIASLLFNGLFSFVVIFNGVLQPFSKLGWWKWMYRVAPFTYLVEGLLSQAISGQAIVCSSTELVPIVSPPNLSCAEFMDPFMSYAGGYLANPDSTSTCLYCPFATTDEYLYAGFNIQYSYHWRDVGIMAGVTVFNVAAIFVLTYIFRIRKGNILPWPKRKV